MVMNILIRIESPLLSTSDAKTYATYGGLKMPFFNKCSPLVAPSQSLNAELVIVNNAEMERKG